MFPGPISVENWDMDPHPKINANSKTFRKIVEIYFKRA
jgi:hypothetical protein